MVKGHPAYSGTIMTATFQMVRELGWEYMEKLAKQRVMQVQSSTDPPKKLSLGERAVMADGNEYGIVLLKEAGQPVEPVYPAEGTPTISGRPASSRRRSIPTPQNCSRHGCIPARRSNSSSTSPRSIRFTRRCNRSRDGGRFRTSS
jgi:hypothetical protein